MAGNRAVMNSYLLRYNGYSIPANKEAERRETAANAIIGDVRIRICFLAGAPVDTPDGRGHV